MGIWIVSSNLQLHIMLQKQRWSLCTSHFECLLVYLWDRFLGEIFLDQRINAPIFLDVYKSPCNRAVPLSPHEQWMGAYFLTTSSVKYALQLWDFGTFCQCDRWKVASQYGFLLHRSYYEWGSTFPFWLASNREVL